MMRIENSTVYTENYQNRRRFREVFERRGEWGRLVGGEGGKNGGCIYHVVPLMFVPFVSLLWASSVLSYIFPPLYDLGGVSI